MITTKVFKKIVGLGKQQIDRLATASNKNPLESIKISAALILMVISKFLFNRFWQIILFISFQVSQENLGNLKISWKYPIEKPIFQKKNLMMISNKSL